MRSPLSLNGMLPGLALAALIAASAMALSSLPWMQSHGLSALTLAIVLGMTLGNLMPGPWHGTLAPGVNFSKQRLLRLGVVLYGFRLTIQDVGHVGWAGIAIDAVILGSTFGLACLIGTRWLAMDRKTSMLIGIGSSVCGAAAVIAAEPVVKGRADQVAVAIATVVVFGTISIFFYPFLYSLNEQWQLIPGGQAGFGIYTGSTVHEVAQVVAIGKSIGVEATDTAVIAKMVRVMMLAPFLICIAAWLARQPDAESGRGSAKAMIPWFAVGFVAVVLFNSLRLLPAAANDVINVVDTALLAMAMAALGVSTRVGAIRQAGAKPLVLALILFAWLVIGGAFVNHWVMSFVL
ncbi:YeiH family protein [Pseudorhodoferax soli]|uniref:Putative integral membrane protein (TIGR00698 family) n=1 Tax=Pseudorhodoferax soli TaxID=545864 RepID=A0A368X5D6_9BURK|nr:YeiH family protein [Pseudorhodoferax soli]RCW63232.1 putative integral membrane protein (TIGR00698 family) [Pseudorhodoferax soli]